MHIHHAGVATDDAAALAATYDALFGLRVAHEETFDGMNVVFVELDGSYLELLEPLGDGVIARYLDEHGPGVHHLAFGVDDVQAALGRARDSGARLVDETPRPGAWGHEVAFLHPESTGGVLVELVG